MQNLPPLTNGSLTSYNSKHYLNSVEPKQKKISVGAPDLICFSHLRWDFVFQRPQHLMSRFAKVRRVFFFEEPIFGDSQASLLIRESDEGVMIVTPSIPAGLSVPKIRLVTAQLLSQLLRLTANKEYIFWYYTPMALEFSRHCSPQSLVYDCMDELRNFKGASPELAALESELFMRASVVFTGGESLYQAKKEQHSNIYAVPSSIDREHFGLARQALPDPIDQSHIGGPRFGFYGVIDERFDLKLLSKLALGCPQWQFIILGPVIKIDRSSLPKLENIHYLPGKSYSELPQYLSNWDVAIMPFAINASTKYISPTKTPEFLAGGKPVVSTPITDVVRPYGEKGLVTIASNVDEFILGCEKALTQREDQVFIRKVDNFLKDISWDQTWEYMNDLVITSEPVSADASA